ncbi:DUF1217 domain-containing protein [Psychromarinibacter sp. S121]|uniref:DUF1217 domain-containing protein n=1 Tax=Psychromarinibacter sp. S121 TaxID=3415127 RepID=UPI003C7DC99A
MISTAGLSPFIGITLVRENRETFEADVQRDPMSKREIESFRERIGSVETVEDLVNDYEVFSFVMKAFGMEEEIYAKAMMKEIFTSDPEDDTSLINRLTDDKYTKANEELGFNADGTAGSNFSDPDWIEEMVDRYTTQRLIDTQTDVNESVGIALAFEQKVSGLTSWYKVLANTEMKDFIMTAFGMPESSDNASVDSLKKMLEKRMDIEDLQDPEVQEKLIRQYSAFAAATETDTSQNAALTLLTQGSSYNMVTIDIDAIQGFSGYGTR